MGKLGQVALVGFVCLTSLGCVLAVIPDYIHVCHRSDPKVAVCIQNSVEALRPLLVKGLPELNVKGIDPFELGRITIFDGVQNPDVKLYFDNVVVTGLGNFKITKLKLDVEKMIYRVGVKVPFLNLTGTFDADMKFGQLEIKTNGDLHTDLVDVDAQAVIHAYLKDNSRMIFDSLTLRLKASDFHLNVDNFPKKDAVLGQTIHQLITETSKQDVRDLATPHIERKCAEILLDLTDGIKLCHRSDPEVETCVKNSVEALKPMLKEGLPELNVPGIDPFKMEQIEIMDGTLLPELKASLVNLEVIGLGDFEITNLKMDLENHVYDVGVKVPFLDIHGGYNVDGKLLSTTIQSTGTFNANATGLDGQALMKGALKDNHLKFESIDFKLKMEDFNLDLGNFLTEDPVLSHAAKQLLKTANKEDIIKMATPYIEKKCSDILLKLCNEIFENVDYDEIFPV
ncbi:hypothetical protein HUJ05_003868 [Dendroctonus ponderosae]|nr:hypothetical protein HUJ05_003868 [Dendroctonus ponderosae]